MFVPAAFVFLLTTVYTTMFTNLVRVFTSIATMPARGRGFV